MFFAVFSAKHSVNEIVYLLAACRLTKIKQLAHLLHVSAVNKRYMNKVPFLLLSLLCEDVTVVSMISFHFSCSGKRESLFGTGVSLNFWHCFNGLSIDYLLAAA